ncbi:MAG: NF038122 family metalloprotease [Blastocatellia bacterium]
MKFRQFRFVFGFILFIAFAAFPLWKQYAQTPQKQIRIERQPAITEDDSPGDGFVIVHTTTGAECRQMTVLESREMRVNERHVEMRTIYSGDPSRVRQGFKITLRSTAQLDQFPAAKEAFQRAARKWESIIQDPISIIVDVDFGPTRFGTPYNSPTILGATSEPILTASPYSALRRALIAGASNPLQTAAYNALPEGTLPTDLGTTSTFRGTTTQLRLLGALDPVANPETEGLAPPAIGFNSAFPFDFDPANGIDADKIDFDATAVHEIGHAIGFVSSVGFKEIAPTFPNAPTFWDLFRLRTEGQSLASSTGQQRPQLSGGTQLYFAGDGEYGLSTGDPTGNGGDRRQASHWKDEFLTGQYIGVMDPTGTEGQPDFLTAADLEALNLFGYDVNPDSQVYELPSVDDNTREESISLNNGIVVNRFTPSRYPSMLHGIRMLIPPGVSEGQPVRVVAFVDANRTGQPPANPAFIADRTLNLPAIPRGRFLDITFTTPANITGGDVYIGVQSANILIAADSGGRQFRRSFLSTNNGASFQPLQNSANAPVNLIARAILSNRFGATPSPALNVLSPSAIAPGSGDFTLTVQGSGFRQNSVVRFNNNDRPTSFSSGTELRAQIPAADVAGAGAPKVTVFTPSAGESAQLTFTIGGDNPAPAIARISPNIAAAGGPATTLNVFGTNFTAQSVIRLNGADLTTARASSTQLTAPLPASALTSPGESKVSVFTPGPGGGTTAELTLAVTACTFALSQANLLVSSVGNPPGISPVGVVQSGVVLNTNSPCVWTATADQPWITLANPAAGNGTGRFVINFNIAENTAATPRTGNLTVGGQTLSLRQFGRATGVSAASFSAAGTSPESIIALFGAGLATETQVAQTQPLPLELAGTRVNVVDLRGTSRPAPLFFAAPGQINFLVPLGTVVGRATVQVFVQSTAPVSDGRVNVFATAPGLFSANANGQGVAAAVVLRVKADGSQVFEPVARFDSAQNRFVPIPIDLGPENEKVFVLFFGVGIRGRTDLNTVSLKAGDITLPVSFAAAAPGFTGLDQINAELPRTLIGKGEVTINLMVGTGVANAVTLTIK